MKSFIMNIIIVSKSSLICLYPCDDTIFTVNLFVQEKSASWIVVPLHGYFQWQVPVRGHMHGCTFF